MRCRKRRGDPPAHDLRAQPQTGLQGIAVVAVVIPLIALVVLVTLGTLFGSFDAASLRRIYRAPLEP